MEHESDEYLHPREAAELPGGVSPKTISRQATTLRHPWSHLDATLLAGLVYAA
jgi:hypothetical protein